MKMNKTTVFIIAPFVLSFLLALGLAPLLAATANPADNIHHLKIVVADFDKTTLGVATLGFLGRDFAASGIRAPEFEVVAVTSPDELRQKVRDGEAYGAVWINAGAGARLTKAATNATYRPLYVAEGAIGFAWDEGRDYLVSAKYVGVTVRSLLGKFAAGYAPSFVAGLIASAGGTTALVSAIATTRPNLLTAPIGFTEENLFPFDVPVALQGEIIGNLVNIVFAFAVALAVLHAFPSLTAGMSKGAQATARVGMVAYMCIVVSACIATILVGLARTNASGNEGHFRAFEGYVWAQVWSAQWLHMMVHALFFAAFDLFHGSKEIMPVYLLIAVLWNATSYLTDTANKGYVFFYYAPMWHLNNLHRHIFFGSLEKIVGQSVGILFLWFGINALWFVACSFFPMASLSCFKRKEATTDKPTPESDKRASESEAVEEVKAVESA